MSPRLPARCLSVLFLLAVVTGCSVLGGRDKAVTTFELRDPGAAAVSRQPQPRAGTLLLRETEASGSCQAAVLLFSRAPGRLDAYQYARWSEPPPRRLHQLIKARLDGAGLYAAIASLGSGVVGDWQLNTRLLECHHDARQAPGVARLSLEAELVRRDRGQLLARRVFKVEAPAAEYRAEAAAVALSEATGQVLGQLTDWLAGLPAAAATAADR